MTFTLYGPRFSVGPFFFFQTSREAAEMRGRSPAIVLFECFHLSGCCLLIDRVGGLLDRAIVRLPGFAGDVLIGGHGA